MTMKKPWKFRVIHRQRCQIRRYFNLDISRQFHDADYGKLKLDKDFCTIYIFYDLLTSIPVASSIRMK